VRFLKESSGDPRPDGSAPDESDVHDVCHVTCPKKIGAGRFSASSSEFLGGSASRSSRWAENSRPPEPHATPTINQGRGLFFTTFLPVSQSLLAQP
jgi:hypothetical protein